MRLSEARLHAVSSRNMYSEHGLDARISPSCGQVCQSFTVVWNWRPGSAQSHAAVAMRSQISRAFTRSLVLPSVRFTSSHQPSSSTASMNVSVRRSELLEDCPLTVLYA